MKSLRKVTSLFLVVVILAGMIAMQGTTVQAAKTKKVQLNKKAVTLEVGKTVTLKLKNVPKKKKITWSSNKKKVASVSKKGVVTAKKAGKANVTAKVSGKKYVCKVVVKGKTKKTTTEASTKSTDVTLTHIEGKNANDVAALQEIINEQNAKGARLCTDASDIDAYKWSKEGRLETIRWCQCGMKGSVNFCKLSALKVLECSSNELSGLDVSKNTELEGLYCNSNELRSLDVSKNTKLTDLWCSGNRLTRLDVSNCKALLSISYDEGKVTVTGLSR